METFWYYKNAHTIDQTWTVKSCGVCQRHIDQAQSLNLYITNDYTFRQIFTAVYFGMGKTSEKPFTIFAAKHWKWKSAKYVHLEYEESKK